MIYLIELLKGLFLALGIIIGFVIFDTRIIPQKNKYKEYDPNDLIQPFKDYLLKIYNRGNYEEINIVAKIISDLELGKIINEVYMFRIKKYKYITLDNEKGKTFIKLDKKYIVLSIKDLKN
jgi:hypothetical protein